MLRGGSKRKCVSRRLETRLLFRGKLSEIFNRDLLSKTRPGGDARCVQRSVSAGMRDRTPASTLLLVLVIGLVHHATSVLSTTAVIWPADGHGKQSFGCHAGCLSTRLSGHVLWRRGCGMGCLLPQGTLLAFSLRLRGGAVPPPHHFDRNVTTDQVVRVLANMMAPKSERIKAAEKEMDSMVKRQPVSACLFLARRYFPT